MGDRTLRQRVRHWWTHARRPNRWRSIIKGRARQVVVGLGRSAQPALLILGWAAVVAGVGELTGARVPAYLIGAGLLLLGFYGFRTLWITVWLGLRTLAKLPKQGPEDR